MLYTNFCLPFAGRTGVARLMPVKSQNISGSIPSETDTVSFSVSSAKNVRNPIRFGALYDTSGHTQDEIEKAIVKLKRKGVFAAKYTLGTNSDSKTYLAANDIAGRPAAGDSLQDGSLIASWFKLLRDRVIDGSEFTNRLIRFTRQRENVIRDLSQVNTHPVLFYDRFSNRGAEDSDDEIMNAECGKPESQILDVRKEKNKG